jgi:type I restriction enzyme S subunit
LLLLAEDGGYFNSPGRGIAYRISGKTWVNNHAHVLRPRSQVDLAYLCRILENFDVSAFISGTTRAKLTKARASQLPIPLPPLEEQRRIAAILDEADDIRRERRLALEKLNELQQAIFHEMFGNPVTNSKTWDEGYNLGELAEIVSGVTKGRELNGKDTQLVSYVTVINVQDRALNLDVVKTIEATENEIRRYRLQQNDLLLTEGGDPDKLGRGTLWNNELPECIHQNHVFRVRLISETLHPVFLNWLVGSERGKRYFLRSAKQTTGIASINMTQLRSFPLIMPPRTLQDDFAARIDAIAALRRKASKSQSKLDALFASLQHRAFAGTLGSAPVESTLASIQREKLAPV